MKNWFHYFFYLSLAILSIAGLIIPDGIRGAVANNIWSIKFMNAYFSDKSSLLAIDPPPDSHKHGLMFLAREALKDGDSTKALGYISPLAGSSDRLVQDSYANILFANQDYEKAIAVWTGAGNTLALGNAVLGLEKNGELELAERTMFQLFESDPERYTRGLARRLIVKKQYDTAIVILEESIEDYPWSSHKQLWLALLGSTYRTIQQYPEAEYAYRQALAIDKEDWETWGYLAWMYYDWNDNLASAIACFHEMIAVDPQRSAGYYQLAKAYKLDAQVAKAISAIEMAIDRMNPLDISYYLLAGSLYEESALFEKAMDAYKEAVKIDPNNAIALKGLECLTTEK